MLRFDCVQEFIFVLPAGVGRLNTKVPSHHPPTTTTTTENALPAWEALPAFSPAAGPARPTHPAAGRDGTGWETPSVTPRGLSEVSLGSPGWAER